MNLKIVVPLVLVSIGLGACGSTNKFEERAELKRERQQDAVEEALSEAPELMTKLPTTHLMLFMLVALPQVVTLTWR